MEITSRQLPLPVSSRKPIASPVSFISLFVRIELTKNRTSPHTTSCALLHHCIMEDVPEDTKMDTGDYVYNLMHISLDEDKIISVISKGKWQQIFLIVSAISLSKEEKLLILDKRCVNWASLSAYVAMVIATFRVTSPKNATLRSKMLTVAKLSIFGIFQESYYPEMVSEYPVKLDCWRSTLRAFPVELCCLLEEGSLHNTCRLNNIVTGILLNVWTPTDDAHTTTIYYITGTIPQTKTSVLIAANIPIHCHFVCARDRPQRPWQSDRSRFHICT